MTTNNEKWTGWANWEKDDRMQMLQLYDQNNGNVSPVVAGRWECPCGTDRELAKMWSRRDRQQKQKTKKVITRSRWSDRILNKYARKRKDAESFV